MPPATTAAHTCVESRRLLGCKFLCLCSSADKQSSQLHVACKCQVITEIKKEGSAWVSKYARGGSARKQAARKMYIVVDALQGLVVKAAHKLHAHSDLLHLCDKAS